MNINGNEVNFEQLTLHQTMVICDVSDDHGAKYQLRILNTAMSAIPTDSTKTRMPPEITIEAFERSLGCRALVDSASVAGRQNSLILQSASLAISLTMIELNNGHSRHNK